MENHRDEHISCADCGTSFLFSAGEAAVFQERGLAAPKRCKDCRRARKDRNVESGGARSANGHRNGHAGGWNGGASRGPRSDGGRPRMGQGGHRQGDGGSRYGAPRYTGDVNEYRSPMQDGAWQQAPWQGYRAPSGGNGNSNGNGNTGNWQPRAPRRGGPGVYRHNDGEYRAPSGQADGLGNFAHADRPRRPGPSSDAGPRRRPQGEMFSITCNSCGAQAEVPFRPAEGRDVFCQACYRARKPTA